MAGLGEDKRVVVTDVSWAEFERRLAAKGESSVPRFAYLDGVLELVTPSLGHERHKSWIGSLVVTYALERGIELSAYGSWTIKDKLRRAGAEPDECYVLGDEASDKVKRPHLAIEVQWSRSGLKKLEIYKRLSVREVWFWDKGAITVHVFKRGKYRPTDRSACLPDLDLVLLCSFLDRPTMTQAIREFRAALAAPST